MANRNEFQIIFKLLSVLESGPRNVSGISVGINTTHYPAKVPLDRLVELGYIVRSGMNFKGRHKSYDYSLTPTGMAFMRQIEPYGNDEM